MAATPSAFALSRFTDLSLRPRQPPQPPPPPSFRPSLSQRRCRVAGSSKFSCCLVSGVDGGGVSDDFVSTRKSGLDRGFSVIANMLRRIEPLDASVISKGVSDCAKDSMKQTISTMLGLLPSDQFSVTVTVSRAPLDRLLVSSIITGYTLWNAEYRISLMKNFDMSTENSKHLSGSKQQDGGACEEVVENEERSGETGAGTSFQELESISPKLFGDLSPEALNYIQKLQSELSNAKQELNAQKQENLQMEKGREHRNDLLNYLRSLDSYMVTELSRPSSLEVEDIIHQLVQNILQRFFKDDTTFVEDSDTENRDSSPDDGNEFCETIGTSRDYLAKLLFWCMLLGHHLRGLENRLHLSCVVGLL